MAKKDGGLKNIILKARESAPLIEKADFNDRTGVAGCIDQKAIDVVREKLETLESLKDYSRAQDVFADFLPDAAKQIVIEMRHARSSSDRRKAAEQILDREMGKPLNRQVSMNITPSDFTDEELRAKTEQLLIGLGYKKDIDGSKLVIESSNGRKAVQVSSAGKGSKGQKSTKKSKTKQKVSAPLSEIKQTGKTTIRR